MKRFTGRRPNAAMVVGMLALVLALGGSAIAGKGHGKINPKKVKSIATKQISKLESGLDVKSAKTAGTAGTANTANSATTANSANTANTANSATNVYTALVDQNGAVVTSIPAGTTSQRVTGAPTGSYDVTFPRSALGCTVATSIGQTGTTPGTILGTTANRFTTEGKIRVATTDVNSSAPADRAFTATLICPPS